MESNEFYTELSVKQKYPEDFGPREVTVRKTSWDVDMSDMIDMFQTILVGMTFPEGSLKKGCIDYLEERGYEVIAPLDVKKAVEE